MPKGSVADELCHGLSREELFENVCAEGNGRKRKWIGKRITVDGGDMTSK